METKREEDQTLIFRKGVVHTLFYVCEERKYCAQFFGFSSEDSKDSIIERLLKVKEIEIGNVVAGYKTSGRGQVRFDDSYFEALDKLVEACKETGIRFWLEDYAPFPTGSASGAYKEDEHALLNKLYIDERHIDISGPVPEAVVRVDSLQNVVYGKQIHRFAKVDPGCRKRIAIIAYRLKENPPDAAASVLEDKTAVILDEYVKNGFLKWDVPEGKWRIFVVYTTYESSGRPFFMNLLSKDSVALEIEKVHKSIYEHLKEELGKTWIGFFYDEPEIGNAGGESVFDFFMLPGRRTSNKTDCNVYSWSPEMPDEMRKRDPYWVSKLPFLWYDSINDHKAFRCDYMDAVTSLVRENYNGQVYAFCRERGVGYIGHVLEDENCHTRLGCGPGHYFRQQYYQDEAGIDIIAGQIMPGKDGPTSWYGVVNADGEFYHYGLAKLASSEARINPLKNNRSVAECFAMYGQQGLAERKFLLDHLLVNGVNRMLLAELPSYQASAEYSKALVNYTEKMCALLRSSKPIIKTAVLYHAEAEWYEGERAQKFQKPASVLARNQISYEAVPADVFTYPERYNAETDGGLNVNGNTYEALIIPACSRLPKAVEEFVKNCAATGFSVFFSDRIPDELKELADSTANIKRVALADLAGEAGKAIRQDIYVNSLKKDWIRYSHVQRGQKHYYLIHNESPRGGTECEIIIESDREVVAWDPMTDMMIVPEQAALGDGRVKVNLRLGQYEMTVLYVPDEQTPIENVLRIVQEHEHESDWDLELPDGRIVKSCSNGIPRPEEYVGYDFYGKLTYRTSFTAKGLQPQLLSLGDVSDCCEVFLNGQSIGRRLAAPYVYGVRNVIREGENELVAEVYTSGGNIKSPVKIFGVPLDSLTAVPYTLVEPMGIRGPVKWFD
jgi:hypothetical protein